MSKKTTEAPRITEDPIAARPFAEPPDNGTQQDPKQRARDCFAAIEAALEQYGCRIAPFLNTEPVGPDPVSKALISATFAVLPNMPNPGDPHGHQ